jgi:hypothetical protein
MAALLAMPTIPSYMVVRVAVRRQHRAAQAMLVALLCIMALVVAAAAVARQTLPATAALQPPVAARPRI